MGRHARRYAFFAPSTLTMAAKCSVQRAAAVTAVGCAVLEISHIVQTLRQGTRPPPPPVPPPPPLSPLLPYLQMAERLPGDVAREEEEAGEVDAAEEGEEAPVASAAE
jgi:hypothetical protein